MRLRRFLLPAVVGVAAYFAVFGGEYSLYEVWRLARQHEQEAAALEALRDSVAALRARADSLESDSVALERLARERYGLIRPGERLYRFVETSDSSDAESGKRR
ncbi:MAG TPA: septum formation initiator family protein [Longimicrobiales bacterium]|nr:septum formation initiator family protein [Longimicrobiales bacterium]